MRAETEAAIEAMRAALPLLREGHGRGEVQVKEALDYVTATDVAVERLIGERLTSAFPEYGVLGEESGLSGSGERFWVIDPICGTTNYAIGLPVYNVNVALVEDGSVTCAALLEPLTERLYWAEKGEGAYEGERRLRVSERAGTVSIDFGHRTATGEVGPMLGVMRRIMERRLWNVRVMAASVVLAYVADGRLAAHVVDDINAWDLCAGALIAEEAGASITDFQGRPWRWDSRQVICAASEAMHAQLLALVKESLPAA